jgi:hypothetical protein
MLVVILKAKSRATQASDFILFEAAEIVSGSPYPVGLLTLLTNRPGKIKSTQRKEAKEGRASEGANEGSLLAPFTYIVLNTLEPSRALCGAT